MTDLAVPDTPTAMEAWDQKSRPWVIGAALAPVVLALAIGTGTGPVHTAIDAASWLIFLIDFLRRRSIERSYVRTGSGVFDLVIVVMTFPFYLIPGLNAASFMSVFRAARVVRLVTTVGLGRSTVQMLHRLGTLGIWLTVISVIAALIVLRAEPPESGFETFGDALWWAMVSFTTVGYGDLYPVTPMGRLAGVMMMFAGLAALGTVAATLSSAIGTRDEEAEDAPASRALRELQLLHEEIAELKSRLDDRSE